MKSKKLISLLCVAALSASSFASLTAFAAAGDKIADVVTTQDYNALTTGMLADGNAAKVTYTDLPYFTLVTTDERKDQGTYTDKAGTTIVSGSFYSIEEKTAEDKYLHVSFPFFGDYTKNGRYAHMDFVDATGVAKTYTADNNTAYVIEFDAKFTYGLAKGVETHTGSYDPVLRIGTFDKSAKKANVASIDKAALSIGDDWVHVKSVTSTKGTKIYLDNAETAAVNSTTTTSVSAFGLYSADPGDSTISPPPDLVSGGYDATALDADKHSISPTVDIDNFKIYTAEPEKEASVTIKYVDATDTAITGKADVTLTGIVGKQFTVPANYKVDFNKDDDQYYTYTSGGDTAITVSETAESNVITLKFTATDKPTITLNAVNAAGTVITKLDEAKAMPGATATVYSKEYVKGSDDKYYQKNDGAKDGRNNPVYGKTVTGTTENQTVTVVYKPAYDVIYYMEAEDFEGASTDESDVYYSSDNYPLTGASGGLRATLLNESGATYGPGFKTESVTKAGTYEITVAGFEAGNKGNLAKGIPVSTLSSQSDDLSHAKKIGEVTNVGVFTSSFTVDLDTNGCFYVGKCSEANVTGQTNRLNAPLDYIVVKDTSLDAQPVPAVTIGDVDTTAATAALTLTNATEFAALGITPKVTLIQAVYDGTALSDVKIWNNVEIDPATGTATATITGAATGASVFYVWDAVGGVRPLGEAKPITVSTPE